MTELAKSKNFEIHGHFATSSFPVLQSHEVELVSKLWNPSSCSEWEKTGSGRV